MKTGILALLFLAAAAAIVAQGNPRDLASHYCRLLSRHSILFVPYVSINIKNTHLMPKVGQQWTMKGNLAN